MPMDEKRRKSATPIARLTARVQTPSHAADVMKFAALSPLS